VTDSVTIVVVTDTVIPRPTRFGTSLRRELDRQKLSIRGLARRLDPNRPDVARRNVARWIGGYNQPSRLNRIAVAEALGLPPEAFLEDDDEEGNPLVALMGAIRRVVRDEIARGHGAA
jgi:transcriptional regulator with XRE-family HTH domain